jgi:hypothetical protein
MALIFTTKGDLDESLLTITYGSDETINETANWTEYHFEGELVKRDVHLILTQPSTSSNTQIGEF